MGRTDEEDNGPRELTYYTFCVEIQSMSSNQLRVLMEVLMDEDFLCSDFRVQRVGEWDSEIQDMIYSEYHVTFDAKQSESILLVSDLCSHLVNLSPFSDHTESSAFTAILQTVNYTNRFDGSRVRDVSSYDSLLPDSDSDSDSNDDENNNSDDDDE